jgi:hypothetical protein
MTDYTLFIFQTTVLFWHINGTRKPSYGLKVFATRFGISQHAQTGIKNKKPREKISLGSKNYTNRA